MHDQQVRQLLLTKSAQSGLIPGDGNSVAEALEAIFDAGSEEEVVVDSQYAGGAQSVGFEGFVKQVVRDVSRRGSPLCQRLGEKSRRIDRAVIPFARLHEAIRKGYGIGGCLKR